MLTPYILTREVDRVLGTTKGVEAQWRYREGGLEALFIVGGAAVRWWFPDSMLLLCLDDVTEQLAPMYDELRADMDKPALEPWQLPELDGAEETHEIRLTPE